MARGDPFTVGTFLQRGGKEVAARGTIRGILGAAVLLASLLQGCGGGTQGGSSNGTVAIPVLYVKGDSGGIDTVEVAVSESADKSLRVVFSENEVGGVGAMTRASMWNVAVVSTIIAGRAPNMEFSVAIPGRVDGPSAGAVLTVGVLSSMRGDDLIENTVMTGTIQPDGTVGPVGGVPEKLKGASEAGAKRAAIPLGLRNTTNSAGENVDVISMGRDLGLEVVEVADVYEAYRFMTGKDLPKLAPSTNVKLGNVTYDRLVAKTNMMLANYSESVSKVKGLSDLTLSLVEPLISEMAAAAERAGTLLDQGLAAGAFTKSIEAWGFARATAATGEVIDKVLFESVESALDRIDQSTVVEQKVTSLFDNLKTFEPRTPSDASALMTAFANSIDALSLKDFANAEIDSVVKRFSAGELSKDDLVSELIMPLLYNEFASVQVDATKELFDAGRDLGSTPIASTVDVKALGDLLRRGADANFEAFSTNILEDLAEKYDRSRETIKAALAEKDLDLALADHQALAVQFVAEYLGTSPAAPYAMLGYGVNNYSRTAQLLLKYDSNGIIDENFDIVDVRSEAALTSSLDLGKSQLSANVGLLRDNSIEPANEVALYEAASLDREGAVSDKVNALGKYWSGYLGARVLAYLSGLERTGLE